MHPEKLTVVGVAEPRQFYRDRMAATHNIPPDHCFDGWADLLQAPRRLADFAIVATQDRDHVGPAVALARLGYHLVLEKPMATNAQDCHAIADACEEAGVQLCVCHVLRYSPTNLKVSVLMPRSC